MHYDPVKDAFATIIDLYPVFRKFFYYLLDLLLLRQRYVKTAIRGVYKETDHIRFYDAGAGFCQYTDFVLSSYPHSKAHAVDLKTDYLRSYSLMAKDIFPGRFSYCEGDLQLYSPRRKYNLVCAIDILEHIEDDMEVLKRFFASMKAGGKLIISTPSNLDEAARFTEEHVRPGYDKTELEDKIVSCGFEIEDSRFTYGFWGALSWKMLIKIPLTLIAQNKVFMLILPLYYLPILPIAQFMMHLDLKSTHNRGTGLLIIAQKPAE